MWLTRKDGLSVRAGLGNFWRWLTGYALVWQFAVVFAALSLVLVGATGFGLSRYLAHSVRSGETSDAARQVQERVSGQITPRLSAEQVLAPLTGAAYTAFDQFVKESIIPTGTQQVKIWRWDGTLIYDSSSPSQIGQVFPISGELAPAFGGDIATRVVSPEEPALSEVGGPEGVAGSNSQKLLAVYAPLTFEGTTNVTAALEIRELYAPVAARIQSLESTIYVGVAGAMGFLYAALLLIVARAFQTVGRNRRQLLRRSQELKRSHDSLLQVLAVALDLRDRATRGHSLRAGRLALALGRELGLSEDELSYLEQAAMLHDVGQIGLPGEILAKPSTLTRDEWEEVQKHPELAYQAVRDVPFLRQAAEIMIAHHERYDGGGYPLGLKGEKIPLAARVFAVADAYDAITSDRPYRKAASHTTAVDEIRRNAGTQFDPRVVEAFLAADRKGLIRDAAPSEGQAEQAAVAHLVAPGPALRGAEGEEAHT